MKKSSLDDPAASWRRYRDAIHGEPLPAAFVDLDALEHNLRRLAAPVRAAGKTLRVCSKSIRCPDLLRHLFEHGEGTLCGVMTYSAAETAYLATIGFRDLLLAYPTAQPSDTRAIALANAGGATAAVVADDEALLAPLAEAAREAATTIPVVLDVDVSFRPLEAVRAVHVGVRRSPLRSPEAAVELARAIARSPGLRLHGVMAYEAQLAGLPDDEPGARVASWLKRALKGASRPDVASRRAAVVDALRRVGLPPILVDGGGSGSVDFSASDPALTEVAAGSGFLASHLFDSFAGLDVLPAAFFALQVVRRPARGLVTCHGGGFVASGAVGADRLPRPVYPAGLSLTRFEGAGEVQTPLRVPSGVRLGLGEPVFFRHAKAGELAEHFNEYLLVRGDRVVGRAPTYRGLGRCFLG